MLLDDEDFFVLVDVLGVLVEEDFLVLVDDTARIICARFICARCILSPTGVD